MLLLETQELSSQIQDTAVRKTSQEDAHANPATLAISAQCIWPVVPTLEHASESPGRFSWLNCTPKVPCSVGLGGACESALLTSSLVRLMLLV